MYVGVHFDASCFLLIIKVKHVFLLGNTQILIIHKKVI